MSSLADDTTSGSETSSTGASTTGRQARPRRRPSVSARQVAHGAKVGSDAIRSRVASVVWIAFVVLAVIIALGALLIALDPVNERNTAVQWLTDSAQNIANLVVPFGGPHGGVFDFAKKSGSPDQVKNVLVNWGIAAVVYLVVGRIADRIIRP
jgi:hypothetical protein